MNNYQNDHEQVDLSDRTVKFGFVPKDAADHVTEKMQEKVPEEKPEQSIAYTPDPYLEDENDKTIAFFDYEFMKNQKKAFDNMNKTSAVPGSAAVKPSVPPVPPAAKTAPAAAANDQSTNIYGVRAASTPYGKSAGPAPQTPAGKPVSPKPNPAPAYAANTAAADPAAKEEAKKNKLKRIFIIIGTVLLAAAVGVLVGVMPQIAFIPLIPIPFLYIFAWPRKRKTTPPEAPDSARGR